MSYLAIAVLLFLQKENKKNFRSILWFIELKECKEKFDKNAITIMYDCIDQIFVEKNQIHDKDDWWKLKFWTRTYFN